MNPIIVLVLLLCAFCGSIAADVSLGSSYKVETLLSIPSFIDLSLTGVQAKYAYLSSPSGLCFGVNSDDLYISDVARHSIFKMSSAGIMTLIAGMGLSGNTPDGYSANNTLFDTPSALGMASNGDLYVADTNNDKIKIVSSSGLVSSISHAFNKPQGIAVSSNNNVYIADTGNNLIKKFDPISKNVSIIGGGGHFNGSVDGVDAKTCLFQSPKNIHVVSNGKDETIYFTDNERVKSIDSNGLYKIVDGGVAQSSLFGIFVKDNEIYTTSSANHFIQKKPINSYETLLSIGQFGSGNYSGDNLIDSYGQVTFYGPSSIVVKDSMIYIADTGNNCIRKVDTVIKVVSTIAGGLINHPYGENIPPSQISSRSAITSPFFYRNELYFVEGFTVLRKVSNGLIKTVYGSFGGLLTETTPTRKNTFLKRVHTYENGDVLIIDPSNIVTVFNIETQVITTRPISLPFSYGSTVYGKSFEEGTFIASSTNSLLIYKGRQLKSSNPFEDGVYSLTTLQSVNNETFIYYISTQGVKRVNELNIENSTEIISNTIGLNSISSSNGKIYVNDVGRIYELKEEDGSLKRIAGLSTFNVSGAILDVWGYNGENIAMTQSAISPVELAFDGHSGDIYTTPRQSGYMTKLSNGFSQTIVGQAPTVNLNSIYSQTRDDENGIIYILDGNTVKKYDEKSKQLTSLTQSLTFISLSIPIDPPVNFLRGRPASQIVFSKFDKKLYVLDFCRVVQIDPLTGNFKTIAGAGCASGIKVDIPAIQTRFITGSLQMAVHSNGDLFLATQEIFKIEKSSGMIRKVFSSAFGSTSPDGPITNTTSFGLISSLYIRDNDDDIYFSTNSKVGVIEKTANGYNLRTIVGNGTVGYSGDNLPALQSCLSNPISIQVKSNGDIVIIQTDLIRLYVKSDGTLRNIAGSPNQASTGIGGDLKGSDMTFYGLTKGLVVNEKTNDIYFIETRSRFGKLKLITTPQSSTPIPSVSPSVSINSNPKKALSGASLAFQSIVTFILFFTLVLLML